MPIFITLIIEIIAFALFIYFFKKVLWGPLMGVMDERATRISDGLAAGERGRKELEEATSNAEDVLKKAREQAHEILANAQRQANDNLERSRDDARAQGERIVAAARQEVEQSVAHAKDELRRQVGQLAVVGAEQILKREVDAKAHNDLIDDLVAGMRETA